MQTSIQNPFVSVVVITYNSSEFIIDTLESIYNQTYKNIELIISDDASKDNTLSIVNKWIIQNQDRFIRTKIIESQVNTGVAPNLNRGIEASTGEWIKSIAGDDTLEPNAIEEYIKFISLNNCNICFAKMNTFGPNNEANIRNSNYLEKIYIDLQLPNRKQQYKAALKRHILPGPGIFYKKSFFYEIGKFNEKYPLAEEFDFQLRVLDKTKIYFINQYLVNWRISPNSLCHSVNKPISKDLMNSLEENQIPRMLKEHMYLYVWDYYIVKYVTAKKNSKYINLYKLIYLLSPFRIKDKLIQFLQVNNGDKRR